MGSRGTKKKSAEELERRGSRRANQRRAEQVTRSAEIPDIPEELAGVMDSTAIEHWSYITAAVAREGLLSKVDLVVVAQYCIAYSEIIELSKDVAENGRSFTTPKGYQQVRPEMTLLNQARTRIEKLAKELGFTPTSRANVSRLDQQSEDPEAKRDRSFFGEE